MRLGNQHRRRLRADVAQLVEELGPTVGLIADRLGSLGARGRPGDEERCVLHSYLQAVVGGEPDVVAIAVRPHAVHLRIDHWRPAIRVPLPLEAQAFIAAFDAGLFPGLVVEPPAVPRTAQPTAS